MNTKFPIVTTIVVKTTFEALHNWSTIPKEHASQFLKYPHRHQFVIEMIFKVSHQDRDLEFFEMKAKIDKTLHEMFPKKVRELLPDIGSMSCEMLAERLLFVFQENCILVKVFEDGENGAIALFDKSAKLCGDLEID